MKRKITKAYCPPGIVEKNPCINWARHIVFGKFGEMAISRSEADGGSMCVVVVSCTGAVWSLLPPPLTPIHTLSHALRSSANISHAYVNTNVHVA